MIVKILKSIAVGILGTASIFAAGVLLLIAGYFLILIPPVYFITGIMDMPLWDGGGSTFVGVTLLWIAMLVLPVVIGNAYWKRSNKERYLKD